VSENKTTLILGMLATAIYDILLWILYCMVKLGIRIYEIQGFIQTDKNSRFLSFGEPEEQIWICFFCFALFVLFCVIAAILLKNWEEKCLNRSTLVSISL
jgi:hypothetical protein